MKKETQLDVYYVGKFWFSSGSLMIKIPKELSEHTEFPLKKERLILIKPLKDGLEIRNVKPC